MNSDFFKRLSENYPFISVCSYANQEYVGIIQNRDEIVTTMYDFGGVVEDDMKTKFLELGEVWWDESNRMIPIQIFLKGEWDIFKPFLRTFNNKSLTVLHGPVCSMLEYNKRRSKRKSITMIRKV